MLRFIRSAGVLAGLFLVSPPVLAEPLPLTDVAMQRHEAGTYYIDGAIRGYGELRMLVDTGSSYVVIGEAILSALETAGEAEYVRELSGVMADGSRRVIPIYRLAALRLGDSCWINDIDAAVFPGVNRPILGMNILARLAPFTFSADPPGLGLNHCQQQSLPEAPAPGVSATAASGAPVLAR